jgi:hypothetical protein
MEWERIAAVTGPGGRGSGYVIAPRLVLTSAHIVTGTDTADAIGAGVTVFRPGRAGSFPGRVVWHGTPDGRDDAALVEVVDPAWAPIAASLPGRVVWGRTVTHRPGLRCVVWGAPTLVQRPGRPVEVVQASGTLNPGDRLVGDRYVLSLDGHAPAAREDGLSPWGGMSGAVLGSAGLVCGVIAVDPAGREHAVLEAVPAYMLLRDKDFQAVMAAHQVGDGQDGPVPVVAAPIELRSLINADESVAPGVSGVRSPAGLLAARRAVVDFHGREGELATLRAWAVRPGIGVQVVTGPGGQGKTRLAHQLTDDLGGQGWAVVWLAHAATAPELAVLGEVVVPTVVVVDYAESRPTHLAALFTVLAGRVLGASATVGVKVLLTARSRSGWWDQLTATSDLIADTLAGIEVLALPVLDDTDTARRDSYRAAVAGFARVLPRLPGHEGSDWAAVARTLAARRLPASSGMWTVLAV